MFKNGSLRSFNALASSGTATTSDLTLPELYRHASAWSQFHTNLHLLMLGKHERRSSAAATALLRGTLPQDCLNAAFRTLMCPVDPLEVHNLLYFRRVRPILLLTWHTGRSSHGCARAIVMRIFVSWGRECRRLPSRDL